MPVIGSAEARLGRLLRRPPEQCPLLLQRAVESWLTLTWPSYRVVPRRYTKFGSLGIGLLVAFFQDLCARYLTDVDGIPATELASARELAKNCRSASYFRLLETCWRLVLALCAEFAEPALPMTPGVAIGVLCRMAEADYSFGYIKNVCTTIAFAHRFSGHVSPTHDERFELVFDCVARALGNAHPNAKEALMLEELRKIGAAIAEREDLRSLQDWAILTLTFFSTFRRANVCAILLPHVRPLGDGIYIELPQSKTDQYRNGHAVFIDPWPEEPLLCPVRAILRWRAQVPEDGGYLFRHLGRLGFPTDQPLADRTIARTVKDCAAAIGLDPSRLAAQSLRAGMITEALLSRLPETVVAGLTGHRTLQALMAYFRPGPIAPTSPARSSRAPPRGRSEHCTPKRRPPHKTREMRVRRILRHKFSFYRGAAAGACHATPS